MTATWSNSRPFVAWTRARRSLTLAYEPDSPSRFLVEAFGPAVIDPDGTGPVRP